MEESPRGINDTHYVGAKGLICEKITQENEHMNHDYWQWEDSTWGNLLGTFWNLLLGWWIKRKKKVEIGLHYRENEEIWDWL